MDSIKLHAGWHLNCVFLESSLTQNVNHFSDCELGGMMLAYEHLKKLYSRLVKSHY